MKHATVSLFSVLLACHDDVPEFPDCVIYEGDALLYATTTDTRVCGGSSLIQDEFVQALAAYFGFELHGKVRYALIDPSEGDHYCFHGHDSGCYYDGKAYSIKSVQYHELTHAVLDAGGYHGPIQFNEGLAEVFGNGMNLEVPRADLSRILEEWPADDSGYYTMALFTRFLIEEYGIEKLLEFLKAAEGRDRYEEFAPAFKAVFGDDLDAAVLDFAAYPSCSRWENRLALLECSETPEPWMATSGERSWTSTARMMTSWARSWPA